MKYKIGDKVRSDGGDWWFYGTVSAVFEHSICPCYRISVERMEKKSCKFSFTQFEFELEACNEKAGSGNEKLKWGNSEIELLKKYHEVLNNEDLSKMLKRNPQAIEEKWQQIRSEQEPELITEKVELVQKPKKATSKKEMPSRPTSAAWDKNLELYQKGEKNAVVYNWMSNNRKLYKTGNLSADKVEKLMEIKFPFDAVKKKGTKTGQPETEKKQRRKRKQKSENAETTQKTPRRKRGEAWDLNLEAYRNGEKSNVISSWVAQNRKEFKTGQLPEKKLDKLMAINFPFDTIKKKTITGI